MNQSSRDDCAKLLLRLTAGVLMLLHGISKLRHGVGGIVSRVESHHLPGFVGYLVLVGEVLAPILLIIGLYTRPAGLVLAINMVVAIWLAHTGDITKLNRGGGWALELQWFYLATGLAIACLGAGRYSLRRGGGRYD